MLHEKKVVYKFIGVYQGKPCDSTSGTKKYFFFVQSGIIFAMVCELRLNWLVCIALNTHYWVKPISQSTSTAKFRIINAKS